MLLIRTTKGHKYIAAKSSSAFTASLSKDQSKRDYFVDWYLLAGMSDGPNEDESLLEDFEESDFRDLGYNKEDLRRSMRRLFEAKLIEEYR